MKTLLTANLSTKVATEGGELWEPPIFTFGESLTLALRFAQLVNGIEIEPALTITGCTAAIGYVDARPQSGEWALQIGAGPQTADNTTGLLQRDCSAAEVAAAINAKAPVVAAYGTAAVRKSEGSWMIVFGLGLVQVPLRVVDNKLFPVSLGRVTAAPLDAEWQHEVRLTQVPVAFTDASERILPPPPSITRVGAGGSSGDVSWNEVQALYVPPDFRGSYRLKLGFVRTGELTVADTPEDIQAALIEALGADAVLVKQGAPFTAHIEFQGDEFGGQAIDLLEVLPLNAPLGDLTFTLDLDTDPLRAWLRVLTEVTLPLEVRITTAAGERVALRQSVTIQRPVIFPELATVPHTDWLRVPSPKDYVPRSSSTVFVGDKSAAFVVGDGDLSEFVLAHPFGTDDVHVTARENVSQGRQLIDGTDFTARVLNADSVEVTALIDPPAVGGWTIFVRAMEPIAAFADDLEITTGQVAGLDDLLAAMQARLTTLEALVPDAPPGIRDDGADKPVEIKLPDKAEVFPGRFAGTIEPAKARPGGLLPAVHDATVVDLVVPLTLASENAGNVFVNNTGAAVLLPGGLGRRSSTLLPGGHAASDGRVWYRVTRAGSTNSYFPADFERELFMLHINEQQLTAGAVFRAEWDLELQLFSAITRVQYLLLVEVGAAPSQSTPATTSTNLQDITWIATPVLSQRLIASGLKLKHHFGCAFKRSANGATITADRLLYTQWQGGAQAPASASFALRARLVQFDTENSVAGARGLVSMRFTNGTAELEY